jgi:hypothetical protein
VTFSAFDGAVVVIEISLPVCTGSLGCAAALFRSSSCSSAVRRVARSRSSSARRFWRSAVSLLRGSSTDQHSHVFITSPRTRRKLVRENIKLLGLRELQAENSRHNLDRSMPKAEMSRAALTRYQASENVANPPSHRTGLRHASQERNFLLQRRGDEMGSFGSIT